MNGDNNGWVKIHRRLLENPKFTRSSRLALWIYILLAVNHTETKSFFNGKEITLKPGQGVFSTPDLARKLCESVSVIRRSLEWFESEQQIEQQKTAHGTVITVLNWHKYQDTEQPSEQRVNNERTTSEQPVNNLLIIQECKECKNVKEKEIKEKETKTDFDIFWDEYPRREGKGAARKAFEKAIKKTTIDVILDAIRKQKSSAQWTRDNGQYIPHPATWLNQERWDDEPGMFSSKPNFGSRGNPKNDIQNGYARMMQILGGNNDSTN